MKQSTRLTIKYLDASGNLKEVVEHHTNSYAAELSFFAMEKRGFFLGTTIMSRKTERIDQCIELKEPEVIKSSCDHYSKVK